ncbi:molybdenum cofactor biosynthesis protein MoaE [Microbacterium sp. LWH3-1.2]|uniref:molybdenum cofactor biosynthesis protein MoaE n=1 Tax=Microbacterium sp. LWH3-1.2 TaxID=3135256 RepID=UPI003422710D
MFEAHTPASADERRVVLAGVTDLPIGAQALQHDLVGIEDGAVVTFEGVVRDHDEGRPVTALRYSAHPTAGAAVLQVAREITRQYPAVTVSVVHRTGDLVIGDCALACVVASAHRREAFQACAELVDLVKERVPIWKEQHFGDGSTEWVNAIG